MATGSERAAEQAGLARALHRLRSTLARLKGELELAELEGAVVTPGVHDTVEEALGHLGEAEALALAAQALVLVVEDDERLATLTTRVLSKEGFAVATVTSIDGLPERLTKAACVIVDLSLLENAPSSLLSALRAVRPIVLSGATDAGSRAFADSLESSVYLLKPVDSAALVAAVRQRMWAEQR